MIDGEVSLPLLDGSKAARGSSRHPGLHHQYSLASGNPGQPVSLPRPRRSSRNSNALFKLHNSASLDVDCPVSRSGQLLKINKSNSGGSNQSLPQVRGSLSRSLDMNRTRFAGFVEEDCPPTILEVPLEMLEETATVKLIPSSIPRLTVSVGTQGDMDAISIDSAGITDNNAASAQSPSAPPIPPTPPVANKSFGLRRKWPSIRQKFSRMGSMRTNSQSSSTNNAQPAAGAADQTIAGQTRVRFEEGEFNPDPDDVDQQLKQSRSGYLKEQFFAFFQPSDNKLAMKLFGNKNALNKEKKRQQQQGKWVIHPCSNFRFYWDVLMLVLLMINLIILPVAISFFNDDLSSHWIVFNCASDTIFVCDIIVNFRTGVVTDDFADEIILIPKEIARHYVKSWFFLDFISSIPMDYIFLIVNKGDNYSQFIHAGRTLRILRLAKLLSMLRLLRLSRLVRYVSQWEEFLNVASKFMGIFNLVLLMLLLGHWNACLQYLIPMLMEFPSTSWVARCRLQNAYWFHQYTWALFKAMSHMLSIGYGRFPPISISEAWITIVSMMTGATCYALFVGHAAALIQSFDTSKRFYREKFKQVEEYMAYRKLPRALRQRIANYYEHRYQGKMFNEAEILDELSECLREQIINYNCRALVAAVPFFTYADQDFVSEVVTKLKYEVFQPGDLIIKEGTIGTKMYFIQEGIVDIITREGEVATSLSDGSYFGEICLLTNAKRVASVRAEVYCNLYSLDREHFLSVLDNYPLMRRTMESVAAERLSKIGQNPCLVTNREDLNEDLDLVKEIVSSVTPNPSDGDNDSESDHDEKKNSSGHFLNQHHLHQHGQHHHHQSHHKQATPASAHGENHDGDAGEEGQQHSPPHQHHRRRSLVKIKLQKLGHAITKSTAAALSEPIDQSRTPLPKFDYYRSVVKPHGNDSSPTSPPPYPGLLTHSAKDKHDKH